MIIKYLKYMIADFLLDQKDELKRLESMLKRKNLSNNERADIKRRQTYLFNQGLRAMRRHDRECPDSVKAFYLGHKPKPSSEKITEELSQISVEYGKINYKIAYVLVALLIALLLFLAII